jgi:hypothetical protein
MSGISGDWAALCSHNERLMQTADGQPRPADASPVDLVPAQWAELASQRERLVEYADPLHGLASSTQPGPGIRLAVKAA